MDHFRWTTYLDPVDADAPPCETWLQRFQIARANTAKAIHCQKTLPDLTERTCLGMHPRSDYDQMSADVERFVSG
jgi:hypothetical protein